MALTSGAMLIERNEGILERCLVSGVSPIEILFSHVTTQFLVMCGQTTLVLIVGFSFFELTNHGDMMWVIFLVVLTGLCGMCFGKDFLDMNGDFCEKIVSFNKIFFASQLLKHKI